MASSSVRNAHTFLSEVREKTFLALKDSQIRAIQIDGHEIHLVFSDQELCDQMMLALSHLECVPSRPSLSLFVWDSEKSGVIPPPPPWSQERYLPRGDIDGFHTEGYSVSFHVSSGSLTILDSERNEGFFWIANCRKMPYWEIAAPFRTIFHIWLQKRGITLVHGAIVATEQGGVLLPGKGGSGKSTTALQAWKKGMYYLADDYSLISSQTGAKGYSLYCSAKMRRTGVSADFGLEELIPGSEKAVYIVRERVAPSCEIRGIVLPKIVPGRGRAKMSPCSKVDAIKGLAPSTIYQLAGANTNTFQAIVSFVQILPCYTLELGSDSESSILCIKECIEG